jgi:Rrf2 family protein
MKLNTTSQYAIRIMTHIVQNKDVALFKAKNISEILNIPYKYMTKIMTQLSDANIISSTRGREGGYSLAKDPNLISMIDLLEAVKECLHGKDCVLGLGLCQETSKCALHDNWKVPKKSMLNMFKNTTLADLI